MDNKMLNEFIRKAAQEAMEDVLKMTANAPDAEPDPDPETVEMLEALEVERKDPDKLLLGALENVCKLIDMRVEEAEAWGSDSAKIAEINRSIADLADTALRMYDRLTVGKTLEKLHFMQEVERRNDENIRKWRDEHEQISGSSRSD